MGAAAPGQLPRDENQVLCMRKGKMKKDLGPSKNAAADDLFVMMQRAHTEDPASKFVRDIKTAPEPAIVLAVTSSCMIWYVFPPAPVNLASLQ